MQFCDRKAQNLKNANVDRCECPYGNQDHSQTLSVLIEIKRTSDGITDNPNEIIINVTNRSFLSDELEVLKLGLRYGLATRPNQLEIMAVAEDVWRQIS